MKSTGTIWFTSKTALALWRTEFRGQLSDGMWENALPRDHWRFWCELSAGVGDKNVVVTDVPWMCKKTGYNFAAPALFDAIGDRMLKIGRMAKVNDYEGRLSAAEYMPDTLEEWQEMHSSGKWQYDFVRGYMENVTPEIATAYYAATYTKKEFLADVKIIKAAMKTAKNV